MAVTPKNCLANQWPTLILSFTSDIISNTEKKRIFMPGKGDYRPPVKITIW